MIVTTMRAPTLTQTQLQSLMRYDASTGAFIWLVPTRNNFDTAEAAFAVYSEAARRLHGEFARNS